MKIIYTPQKADKSLSYAFPSEGVVEATMDGESDTFDFSEMPDGKAEKIESTLFACPVVSAEKVDGELTVKLLHWYGPDAADEEKTEREVII
jgi:hypothetical protein